MISTSFTHSPWPNSRAVSESVSAFFSRQEISRHARDVRLSVKKDKVDRVACAFARQTKKTLEHLGAHSKTFESASGGAPALNGFNAGNERRGGHDMQRGQVLSII